MEISITERVQTRSLNTDIFKNLKKLIPKIIGMSFFMKSFT